MSLLVQPKCAAARAVRSTTPPSACLSNHQHNAAMPRVASSTTPQPQPDQPGQSAQPAQPTPASHVACATSVHPAACLAAGQSVILQTASTTVYAEQGNRSASVRLLLDSGSQRTYMSRRLAESLHLQPALHEPLSISTFGDTRPFTVRHLPGQLSARSEGWFSPGRQCQTSSLT